MRIQLILFLAAMLSPFSTEELHSQDEANKAIREYKEKVSGANKAYSDSVESARGKKKQEIEAATKAALNALKAELAKTGPGDIARAIELAKRIYQLDSTDKEARKILLAANIALGGDAPPEAARAPVENPVKPPVPQKDPAQPKAPRAVVPAVQEPAARPIQPPAVTPSNFGVFGASSNQTPGSGNYPIQVNKRPLTLPAGASSGIIGIGSQKMFVQDWGSTTLASFGYGGFYGVSENLQLGIASGFGFSEPLSGLLPIELYGTYSVFRTDFENANLSTAVGAYMPVNIGDIYYGPDPDDTIPGISIGLPSRLNFANDAVAVHFGHGLLSLGYDTTVVNFNMGLSFQVADNFNIGIDTRLFDIGDNYYDRPFNWRATYSMTSTSEFSLVYLDNEFSAVFLGWIYRNL